MAHAERCYKYNSYNYIKPGLRVRLLKGRFRIFHVCILHNQVKEDEMGEACNTHGEMNAYTISVGKPEGNRPSEGPRRR
jgi:hypothetical protein